MASSNNSKVISTAKPHTIKKFELIESYIISWAQKLMNNSSCNGLIFIDCMCNSGVYKDIEGNTVYGTPIRVANALLDVARTYTNKQVQLFFNDFSEKKIEELKKHLPPNERNFEIITTTRDANNLLTWFGSQLDPSNHFHYFLLYDPYDASIKWDALAPFFRNWGEVLINHMISDSIRAIPQAKKEQAKRKYTETYQVDDITDLVPYGSDKEAYENRLREIIEKLKGTKQREYYVATFPFFNTRNALVYDLVHCTSNEVGFKLFKSQAWKVFDGKSSSKKLNNEIPEGQMIFDFVDEQPDLSDFDEYCYTLDNAAQYLQKHFCGASEIPKEEVWDYLDKHPVFTSDGFRKIICGILKTKYNATISRSTISFSGKGAL